MPAMRSTAIMAEPVSPDLPRSDIDVCVLLVLKESIVEKVGSLHYTRCVVFIFRTAFSKFILIWEKTNVSLQMIEKYISILIFADINECKTGEHNCDADHMYCNNTKGSFACLCKPGFTRDGLTCTGNKIKMFRYQESNKYQSKFYLQS